MGKESDERLETKRGTRLEERQRRRGGLWNWFRSMDHWKQSSLLNSPPTHPTDVKLFFGMIYREPSKQVDIVSTDVINFILVPKTCTATIFRSLPRSIHYSIHPLSFYRDKNKRGERREGERKGEKSENQ